MAKDFSFDIVSEFDKSEMDHAVDQARRELTQRYDFKGTSASIDFDSNDKNSLILLGDSDYQIDALIDMLRKKFAKRNLSQKILDVTKAPEKQGMTLKKVVPLKSGLNQEQSKTINKIIRDNYPKAKSQVQGESIRVSSAKKDELQAVMQLIKEQDFDFPISFNNFR